MMATTKGRARIYVHLSPYDWPEGVQVPVAGQIAYDVMEVKELFDAWSKFLLLPESYEMVGVYFDIAYQMWVMVVESEAIPLTPPDRIIPRMTPRYQAEYFPDGTRKVSLTELELEK